MGSTMNGLRPHSPFQEEGQRLHAESMVWILHDHFYHRLDANLAMKEGGVTAKTVVPVADLAIYNDSEGEDDWAFYRRTLEQTDGWATESLVRLQRAQRLFEARPDRFILAEKAKDVLRAKQESKTAIFFGLEGCKAFEGRIELLHVFYRLGVRQMQLVWSHPNQLVEISPDSRSWRLSGFGRDAISAMNEWGIVIDLAHAPWSLFEEVVRYSKDPVIVSHGAPKGVHAGSGDMSTEHLEALKGCGGLLGLHFCRHYINGPFATFDDFLDTVAYLLEEGYEDIIALGGDLFEDDAYFRARHPPPSGATHENWRVFIEELRDLRLIPNTTRGLLARGCPKTVIKKILGGNALRLYQSVI